MLIYFSIDITSIKIDLFNNSYFIDIIENNILYYLIQEIPNCEIKIITDLLDIDYLQNLKQKLNLEKYINFISFTPTPEIYFKNSSLHIFPSISECFPMVLCETKIYGIPNILCGIDYVRMAEGGIIILYDDSPESISKEAINIISLIFCKLLFNLYINP